jgi:alkyl sulfatase BDS1-like metallo-beta-lactamase superfamily hydrolase
MLRRQHNLALEHDPTVVRRAPYRQTPPVAASAVIRQTRASRLRRAYHDRDDSRPDAAPDTAAERGFIAALTPGVVRNAAGEVIWDNDSYSFLTGQAPDTVDPSLWRQSA